jgi:hypothetical protein
MPGSAAPLLRPDPAQILRLEKIRANLVDRLQAGLRALVEQSIAHLASAWALRR